MAQPTSKRLVSIDIVRGIAMLLMIFRHSSMFIPDLHYGVEFGWGPSGGDVFSIDTSSWLGLLGGSVIFFLMAGYSIALFENSRRKRSWSEWQITRYFLIRGLVLIAIDWLLLPWDFKAPYYNPNRYFVLFGIGLCLWVISVLRFFPLKQLVFIAIIITVSVQCLYFFTHIPDDSNLIRTTLLYPSPADPFNIGYPLFGWLPVMLLGYITSRYLINHPEQFSDLTLKLTLLFTVMWLMVTWIGTLGILHPNHPYPNHPLIMTKHPPSLAYLSFGLILSHFLLYLFQTSDSLQSSWVGNKLSLLGQTAFFFYVIHLYLLRLVSFVFNHFVILPISGVTLSIVVILITLFISYPVCLRYRHIRKIYYNSFLQYL